MAHFETVVHRFGAIEEMLYTSPSRKGLFSSSDFQQLLAARLEALMPEEGILSLDVFDTLILRDNSSELTRFVEIGDKMADIVNGMRSNAKCVRGLDAFLARHLGTKATYRASTPVKDCREGSLNEIHALASRLLIGSDDLAEDFIKAEISYESTRIVPSRMLLDIIHRHKQAGGCVVLISDTYMHAGHITCLLKKLGIDLSLFEQVISSADTKVSKASGGIFSIVEEALEAESAHFLHIGDSLEGDFRKPMECGWRALHLPVPEAEIAMRRQDHLATADHLRKIYGLAVDIAMPH